jgi:hypothetical protein
MQEITLSQYSAEIERLLQDEAYDEAIAHCMHILKRYPNTSGPTVCWARLTWRRARMMRRWTSSPGP